MTLYLLWEAFVDNFNEEQYLVGIYQHPVDAHLQMEEYQKNVKGVDHYHYYITEEELK